MPESAYDRPIPRAYGVALRGDEVLLVRASRHSNAPGLWWLPGGGIDWRESPEDALVREVREETGLTVRDTELLMVRSDVRTRDNGDVVHTIRVIYTITVSDDELVHEIDGTTDLAAWVPLGRVVGDVSSTAAPLELAPYSREAIEEAHRRQRL